MEGPKTPCTADGRATPLDRPPGPVTAAVALGIRRGAMTLRAWFHRHAPPALLGGAYLAVAVAVAGCGGASEPTNFPPGHGATVAPQVRQLTDAWVAAQRTQDHEALEALYDPTYAYAGRTRHEIAETFLVPRTADTSIAGSYELLEPPAADAEAAAAQVLHGPVMLRVHFSGQVSASVIEGLAGESTGEEDDHEHTHSHAVVAGVETADLDGTVTFDGKFDVVLQFGGSAAEPLIAAQRVHLGAITYGGGAAAAVIRNVHTEPAPAHCGEGFEAQGRFALLPPGGVIHAGLVGGESLEAAAEAGEFDADLTAPDTAGIYLLRIGAHAGDVEARTASITTVEREVHVHEHEHDG